MHPVYKSGIWHTKLAFRFQICSFQFTNKHLALQTGASDYNSAWEKRSIRMGKGLYYVCCVLGAICAAIVAFNLFKDLNVQNAIICSGIIIALVVLSYWRLKIGAVKKEDLERRKEEIVKAALAAEE